MKRLFDIFVVLALLVLIWPLLLIIAFVVRIDSPGPVFYRQQRVGLGGREFGIYKFRSMVNNAYRVGSYQTAPGDSRITRVGCFLRKTSLDELPQFLNVLIGDMSLVGPRPDVSVQRDLYSEADWAKRVSVRPGITGLAQATLCSAASPWQRLALELKYVEQASMLFVLKLLLLTVRQVLGKRSH